MSELKDKVVLITGAGHGLGRELVANFGAQGAIIAANDLTPVNVEGLVTNIQLAGGQAKTYLGDISKKLSLQTLITDVLEDWGRIDILVNHASVQPRSPLLDMDEWDWRRTLEVNLTGTFVTTQVVGRVMRELGGGVIVNVGPADPDDESQDPRAAYLASKAGVLALTDATRRELAPYNIRVHAVQVAGGDFAPVVEEVLGLCK